MGQIQSLERNMVNMIAAGELIERPASAGKRLLILAVTVLVFCCNATAGSEAHELKVVVERNVPVPMRDGTILRADVYRPDRGGPYPVLVQRTPYGKDGNFDRFVKAGYIVVSQDVRGRYESEGRFEYLRRSKTHDAEDGYDTIVWAAKLHGSTGKVGTFGASYCAFLQWRLAPLHPSPLACMSATLFGIARLVDGSSTSGIRPGIHPRAWAMMATDMQRRENLPGVHTGWEASALWRKDSEKWINWLPWLELPEDFFGYETNTAKQWLKNPNMDPWRLDEDIKEIVVPNLEITGWYDTLGDMVLFQTMVKEAKTEVARNGSRIIIGPWGHSRPTRSFGNIDFGPDTLLDMTELQIRWFDHWLKGSQNGVDKDPPLKIFVMGDNKWRDEQQWPLRRTQDKVLYITSDGHANTPNGNGKLVAERPQSGGADNYVYDPRNPVPTPYGAAHPRTCDQRPLAKREDILVYQTEPLSERLEVTGNPVVELYSSSSTPDTDWFVRLIDVHPDGLARDVCMGMVRARYRYSLAKPELLTPGDVVKYTIRMRPTSNAFLPGHRIRLDITSSDFPWYDRNHNTPADQTADATLVTAKQTIYHGSDHTTRIILPWMPNPPEEEKPAEEEKVEQGPEKRAYPLHEAAASGHIEQVRMLLSKGADINSLDEKKNAPLGYAVTSGGMEVVQMLVEAGADVNAGKLTPLSRAVYINDIAMAEYLIAHGADVNAPEGWTALQAASRLGNNLEMVKLLMASGADVNVGSWTPLQDAINEGHRDIAKLLIANGADVNIKHRSGKTPLDWAISYGMGDVAELLIQKGAEVNALSTDINTKNSKGLTALHYMSAYDSPDTIELLLSRGAKVDERDDNYEFTALHYAARFGNKNVAEVLIAHGADIKAKDKWDYEPIHWAAYHDRPEIVELLVAKGADVNAKTSLGQTPLELAIPRRNTAAIEVLRKYGAKE